MNTFLQPKKISANNSVFTESLKCIKRFACLIPLLYWLVVAFPGLLMGIFAFGNLTPPKALYSMAVAVLVPVLHFGGSMAILHRIIWHTDGIDKADSYIRTLVKPVVFFWTVIWISGIVSLKHNEFNGLAVLMSSLGCLALSPGIVAWRKDVRPIPVTIGYYSFTAGYLVMLSILA